MSDLQKFIESSEKYAKRIKELEAERDGQSQLVVQYMNEAAELRAENTQLKNKIVKLTAELVSKDQSDVLKKLSE